MNTESGQAVAEYLTILGAIILSIGALSIYSKGNIFDKISSALSEHLFSVATIIHLPF